MNQRRALLFLAGGFAVPMAVMACGGPAFQAAPSGGGGNDAAIEASQPDAGTDGLALQDGGAPETGQPTTGWCSMQTGYLFCDDFSEAFSAIKFPNPTEVGGGKLSFDSSDYTSSPQSLQAATPALPAVGASAAAIESISFTQTGEHYQFQGDFEVATGCFQAGDAGDTDFVTVAAWQFPGNAYGLALLASASETVLLEETFDSSGKVASKALHILHSAMAPGTWTTVTLNAKFGATPKTVDMTVSPVGGMVSTGLSGEAMMLAPLAVLHPTLTVGALTTNVNGISAGCVVHVDDVLFDIKSL